MPCIPATSPFEIFQVDRGSFDRSSFRSVSDPFGSAPPPPGTLPEDSGLHGLLTVHKRCIEPCSS
eukprot:scaffold649_cov347-Pavlova_lutheri.AAC.126